ncbi:hypothetical protein Tco_0286605, partial [Tanacetum coccineum]
MEWWLGLKEGANRDQHSRDQRARSGGLDPKRGANRDQHSHDQRGRWFFKGAMMSLNGFDDVEIALQPCRMHPPLIIILSEHIIHGYRQRFKEAESGLKRQDEKPLGFKCTYLLKDGGPLFGQGILSSEVPIAIAVDVPLIIVVAICKSIYVDRWMEDTIGRLDWWPPFAETHYRGQYISVYGSSARSSALQTGNFRFLPCSHGDFLGSILETGIVRDKVRDIVLL